MAKRLCVLIIILTGIVWLLAVTGISLAPTLAAGSYGAETARNQDVSLSDFETVSTDLSVASLGPADYSPWMQMVYQKYEAGNWDIYLFIDYSTRYRLTTHSAIDVEPRISRGCHQIAFASDRNGNFDIYTMLLDGTSKTRLTSNPADDNKPAWSPDSSKIAFQSYRDGNWEIYVMPAAGGIATRLTWSQSFDGQPYWSPDGDKLLFTSDRSGDRRIWIMGADGSNPKSLSTQHNSGNPVWSPNREDIAYDADSNYDGAQEIWMMKANGSNQTLIAPPDYREDRFAGSFRPTADSVYVTKVDWTNDESESWYWNTAELAYKKANFFPGETTLFLEERAGNALPDWATCDVIPPDSFIYPVPFVARDFVWLRTFREDFGGSYFRHLDHQVRDGVDSEWTDMEPNDYDRKFVGEVGHTYYFRSRAIDNAWNIEEWPPGDGDASVTFADWAIRGTGTDNRGQPLAGIVVTGTDIVDTPISDNQGDYLAFFIGFGFEFSPSWEKEGFGSLPVTDYNREIIAKIDVVMPPADNVVSDWGFESGTIDGIAWTDAGNLPAIITQERRHNGDYGVMLGQEPVMGEPMLVMTTNLQTDVELFVHDEIQHHVWSFSDYFDSAHDNIYHQWRDGSGEWSQPVEAAPEADDIYRHRWEMAPNGDLHLFWTAVHTYPDLSLFHAVWKNGSGWSEPHLITRADGVTLLDVAFAVDGACHLVWYIEDGGEKRYYYGSVDDSGTWSPNLVLEYKIASMERIAVNYNGDPHLLYDDGWGAMEHLYRDSDGNWLGPEQIDYTSLRAGYVFFFGADDTLHLMWQAEDGFHMTWTSSDGWTDPTKFTRGFYPRGFLEPYRLDDGRLLFAWFTPSNHYYTYWEPENGWHDPIQMDFGEAQSYFSKFIAINDIPVLLTIPSTGHYFCITAIHPDSTGPEPWCIDHGLPSNPGDLIVASDGSVWMTGFHNYEPYGQGIYLRRPVPNVLNGSSSIEQVLTIPEVSNNPTLSLIYSQFGRFNEDDDSGLAVKVNDGLKVTTVLTDPYTTSGWTHRWADLSEWAGQAITLSISSRQPEGTQPTILALDEVTLGVAYPDSWLDASQRYYAMPGDTVVTSFVYGNNARATAISSTITMTMPDDVIFVAATPPPLVQNGQLVWDAGDLENVNGPLTIVVTFTIPADVPLGVNLSLPIELSTSSPELDMDNNLGGVEIWIRQLNFLPLIRR